MNRRPTLARLTATLLCDPPSDSAAPRYRLLVVGPAILHRRHGDPGPWRVRLSADGTFLPAAPRSCRSLAARLEALRRTGRVRLGAALLEPRDLAMVAPCLRDILRGRASGARCGEFYGWSLLYRLPNGGDDGLVDPHERHADLPAVYESPLELADRQAFLTRRGVPTRPIAIVTQQEDFDIVAGDVHRNRYVPRARWRRACSPAAFVA